MFESRKLEYISWAINTVEKNPEYHAGFYPIIMEFIKSDNSSLANHSLGYFRPELFVDTAIQKQLVQVMRDLDLYLKNKIILKFIEFGNVDDQVVYNLLNMFIDDKLGVMSYNFILRLVSYDHIMNNQNIIHILKNLAKHENKYVRDLTQRMLDEKLQSYP